MKSRLSVLAAISMILIISIAAFAYLESKEKIAEWVKKDLKTKIQENEIYKGITIGEVLLVRESANKFTVYVEFKYGTDTEKATLTVIVDGSQIMYQCEPPRALIIKKNLENLDNIFR